ncbi:hypothetical protein BS47DRAFT_428052 [Hydnum rufescens UP504]|uniref:Uncharacterized protein n=1 Tax=Hydnum rufescens UP504 TaxID=1448309 RepID=A0A9P6AJ26_9AGAM|nr:hypothetical protein BS47DRAFT_428052 [Hydnum rufescens UP504]
MCFTFPSPSRISCYRRGGTIINHVSPEGPHPFWYIPNTPPGLNFEEEYKLRLHLAIIISQETSLWHRRFGEFLFLGFIPIIGNLLGVREMIRALKLLKDDFQIPEKLYRRMLLRLAVPTAASCLPILGSFIVAAYKPGTRNGKSICQFMAHRMKDAELGEQEASVEKGLGRNEPWPVDLVAWTNNAFFGLQK